MRTIILPPPITQKLAFLPESGMGYQVVSLTLRDGRVLKRRNVINGEQLVLDDGEIMESSEIREVSATGIE
jgi:hypothetical protein